MIISDQNERTDVMFILGRLIRRNITGKPLRSFAIIIALAASAFAMLFCVAGREAPEQAMRERMLAAYGGAEMLALDRSYDLKLNKADFPSTTTIVYIATINGRVKSQKGEYSATFRYMDTKEAKKLGICESEYDAGSGVIISEAFSKKAGLKQGDSITLTVVAANDDTKPESKTLSLKVNQLSSDKYMRRHENTVFLSMDNYKAISGRKGFSSAMIDLPNDVDAMQFCIDMQKKYEKQQYTFAPLITDDLIDEINNQTTVFYLIFAVILLMTLFLTFSMSRHIANERLSSIGTLRSIGGSIPKTSALLIIESAVYGLVGGIIGAVIFMFCGYFAVTALFGTIGDYTLAIWWYPISVLLAVIIQIVSQSGALIKAVKTPVRDIIFSSRDAAYHISKKKVVVGAVMLSAGLVTGMFVHETIPSIAAISLVCVGSVMVVPIIIKLVSMLFVKLFGALGLSCAKFAANECSHKKSTVTSTQLTFIALAITTAVLITSGAIKDQYSTDHYNYEVAVNVYKESKKCEFITKIDGVQRSEIYTGSTFNMSINGNKKTYTEIAAFGEFKLNPIIEGIKAEPAEGEAVMGSDFAEKYSVKTGDTIRIVDEDDYIVDENGARSNPTFDLKIVDICPTVAAHRNLLVVNRKWYITQFGDRIDTIYADLSDKLSVDEFTQQIQQRLPDADVITAQQQREENEEDSKNIMTILYSIFGVGCVLSLLGAVSNAVIGFEQSKRKYAVLHSVAASKKKLSKLIMLETLFSSLTAGILAVLLGTVLTKLIDTTLDNIGMVVAIRFDIVIIAAFMIAMIAVLLLAAVKPIVSLRKMNTAAELKYE